MTVNHLKLSHAASANQSAYYIAEAGINQVLPQLHQDILDTHTSTATERQFMQKIKGLFNNQYDPASPIVVDGFAQNRGELPQAKVWIEEQGANQYTLISQGFIGKQSRIVEKPFSITWIPPGSGSGGVLANLPSETAAFANGQIVMTNGTIRGSVGTNASANGSINVTGGNPTIHGTIYGGPGSTEDLLLKHNWQTGIPTPVPLEEVYTLEMPPFPLFPKYLELPDTQVGGHHVIENGNLNITDWRVAEYTLELQGDLAFKNMNFNGSRKLIIDVGDTDKAIVVDHLNIPQGHIELRGSGKLTIYVREQITLGGSSTINNHGDIAQLEVFYAGSSPLTLSGSQKVFGSLFAEQADLEITGGGSFQGSIVTGGSKVKVSGGGSADVQVFYAPNADVELSGGGSIYGTVIAKTINMHGGTLLEYPTEGIDFTKVPFLSGGGSVGIDDLVDSESMRES